MQLVRSIHNLKSQLSQGCVATIGDYDGLHLGHLQLITTLVEVARASNLPSLIITFEPLAKEFFAFKKNKINGGFFRLGSLRDKLCLLRNKGVDYVLLTPFTAEIAKLSAGAYFKQILIDTLGVKALVVGDDFVFGCDQVYSDNFFGGLKPLGGDFKLIKVQLLKLDTKRISSTTLREALIDNDFETSKKLLGRPYGVTAKVGVGNAIGHKLGFPTANLVFKRELPWLGVYIVKVFGVLLDNYLWGIANIGYRPTFGGSVKKFEVHLAGFRGNLYKRTVYVEFVKKIREERFFSSLDELKQQIAADLEELNTFRSFKLSVGG
jgi:riboflavin kinase/FMN adenylyltransferase